MRCMTRSCYRLRPVDSDVAEIVGLITTASLCDDCIATKTGIEARQVPKVLNQAARLFEVRTRPGRCDACLKQTVVHRLG